MYFFIIVGIKEEKSGLEEDLRKEEIT